MKCVIFDIDGTLADCSHRIHHIKKQPKDWDSFFAELANDKPIDHVVELARMYQAALPDGIVFVSGRPERTRGDTMKWLREHKIHNGYSKLRLYMRADGDRRDDDIVKFEILTRMRGQGLFPAMAFDDRDRIVKMWRANGVPCFQVAEGNF